MPKSLKLVAKHWASEYREKTTPSRIFMPCNLSSCGYVDLLFTTSGFYQNHWICLLSIQVRTTLDYMLEISVGPQLNLHVFIWWNNVCNAPAHNYSPILHWSLLNTSASTPQKYLTLPDDQPTGYIATATDINRPTMRKTVVIKNNIIIAAAAQWIASACRSQLLSSGLEFPSGSLLVSERASCQNCCSGPMTRQS